MKFIGAAAKSLVVVGLALSQALFPAVAHADGGGGGGWSDEGGYFLGTPDAPETGFGAGQAKHTGKSEEGHDGRGTTIKRAHGWTTWTGVKHYTQARMFKTGWRGADRKHLSTDSGQRWGKDGTEAISPWSPFNPDIGGTPGSAVTNYGRK